MRKTHVCIVTASILSLVAAAQSQRDAYRDGKKALDGRQWEKAFQSFSEAAKGGPQADAALYWKAYAQDKLVRRDEALATLAELLKTAPNSRWANDARALDLEIRQAAGAPVSPERAADDELKLLVISGLVHSDPERAVPLLETVLAGAHSPKLKERALFVLTQSRSPRAREIVTGIARGTSSPALQSKALEYLGLFGGKESRQALAEIYAASSDAAVKRKILRSFMLAGEHERLLAVAKEEKSPELRREAVQQLGLMGKRSGDALVALYQPEPDKSVRKAILRALFLQGNAKALIEIARKETDPELKKDAVRSLSLMRSKEAVDFMVEILNK